MGERRHDAALIKEVKSRFGREISLRGFTGNPAENPVILRHCQSIGISHEYDDLEPFRRYYYSDQPLFYLGNKWSVTDSPLRGAEIILTRVLRTALFINVTLPSMVNLYNRINDRLVNSIENLQNMRVELFNSFKNKKLYDSHKKTICYGKAYNKIIQEIDRVDEAHKGFKELLEDIKMPFHPSPLYDPPNTNEQSGAYKDNNDCLDLFHFQGRISTKAINDRTKAVSYIREITNHQKSMEIKQRRFESELSNINTLLESRRTLLKDRENTLFAIIVPAFGAVVFGLVMYFLWPWR